MMMMLVMMMMMTCLLAAASASNAEEYIEHPLRVSATQIRMTQTMQTTQTRNGAISVETPLHIDIVAPADVTRPPVAVFAGGSARTASTSTLAYKELIAYVARRGIAVLSPHVERTELAKDAAVAAANWATENAAFDTQSRVGIFAHDDAAAEAFAAIAEQPQLFRAAALLAPRADALPGPGSVEQRHAALRDRSTVPLSVVMGELDERAVDDAEIFVTSGRSFPRVHAVVRDGDGCFTNTECRTLQFAREHVAKWLLQESSWRDDLVDAQTNNGDLVTLGIWTDDDGKPAIVEECATEWSTWSACRTGNLQTIGAVIEASGRVGEPCVSAEGERGARVENGCAAGVEPQTMTDEINPGGYAGLAQLRGFDCYGAEGMQRRYRSLAACGGPLLQEEGRPCCVDTAEASASADNWATQDAATWDAIADTRWVKVVERDAWLAVDGLSNSTRIRASSLAAATPGIGGAPVLRLIANTATGGGLRRATINAQYLAQRAARYATNALFKKGDGVE